MAALQRTLQTRTLRPGQKRWFFAIAIALIAFLPTRTQGQTTYAAMTQWRTYLGGTADDQVLSVALDAFGHVYVAGRTSAGILLGNDTSGRSGVTHQDTFGGGVSDAFLAKIAPQGSMLWCTYFGGPGDDEAVQVLVTEEQGIVLIGNTNSTSDIATDTLSYQSDAGGGSDMFIAYFAENGLLLSSTYFGGVDDEFASGAALDALNRIVVCGNCNGPDAFTGDLSPIRPWTAGTDGLLLCFHGTDSLVSGTYIGGAGEDSLVQVTRGDSTGFHLLGTTTSTTDIATADAWLPEAQGGSDAFILKADTNLLVLRSTYFGGNADDRATGLVQRGSELVICGLTYSDSLFADTTAIHAANAGGGDGFVAILDSSLTLTWSTFVGDTAYDMLAAVQVDIDGRIYGAGLTRSSVNIATTDGGGAYLNGDMDAFAMRIDSGRALAWSRYLGAMGEEEAHALSVAGRTSLFIGGRTSSESNFALLGHQMQYGGGDRDGFALRLNQKESTECNGICTGTSSGSGGSGSGGNYNGVTPPLDQFHVCRGDSVTFIVHGGALGIGARWMWYWNGCGIPEQFLTSGDTITIAPTSSFTLSVRAETTETTTSCRFLPIVVHNYPDPIVSIIDSACAGAPVHLLGSGADSFSWLISDSLITGADVIVQAPLSPGVNVVEITATNGPACSVIRMDTLIVLPAPAPLWNIADVTCAGGTDGTIAADSLSASNLSIIWETAGLEGSVLTDLGQGTYITTVTDPFGCSSTDTLFVHMPLPLIDSLSTTDALCGEPVGVLEIHSASTSTGLTFQLNGDSMGTWMVHDLVPGAYGLLATDSVGCLEERSFIISALGTITANIVGDTVLAENGEAQLYCSVLPFDSLATYIWIPETGLDGPTSNSPFCTVTDTAYYMVIATSYAGCKAEDTVLVIPWFEIPPVVPDPCGEAFLPNIFSPNHDGLNDELCVLGGCFTSLSLAIYDRWGQRVYHSTIVDACWDGTHGGTDLPSGAYAFTLYAERSNGDVLERTGTLTLKR